MKKDEKDEAEAIKDILEILNSQGAKWWIDHGTLLGFVREGKPIEWDKDFDIGTSLTADEVIEKILPLVKKAGYRVFFDDSCDALKIDLKNIKSELTVDIACYVEKESIMVKHWPDFDAFSFRSIVIFTLINLLSEGEQIINNSIHRSIYRGLMFFWIPLNFFISRNHRRKINNILKKYIPNKINMIESKYFEQIIQCKYEKLFLNQPRMASDYLNKRYGDEWRIPKKEWNYLQDDGGIVK